jgi:Fe-S oxidoreductase
MCYACVAECPVLIGHVDFISDMRRHLVGEGKIAGPPASALRHLGSQSNPYAQPAAERLAWTQGLDVPTVDTNPDFEYLLWVGCAAAFDPRAREIARATARLLKEARVNFAILGEREGCTGDPARRLGDEFLFQELAQTGIQTLDAHRVRNIITPCPHCFNTIKNEYPQFGGQYQVQHHAQFLAELLEAGRLDPGTDTNEPTTLHDPCYLARVNGEVDAQRKLIGAGRQPGGASEPAFREMPRHGEKTFCCGAGGGRMWFDEQPEQRVSHQRAREAVATGAKTLVTACPFCLNMMSDGMSAQREGEDVRVMDIAELLIERRTTPDAD